MTKTEREVLRHLSLSEPMTKAALGKATGLDLADVSLRLCVLRNAKLARLAPVYGPRRQRLGSGYILTPAGADLCEAMERERAELNAIAAQATREHGEPDGDALMQSPRFFSPPVKPSLWARVKAAFRRAA